jgi:hypothetical protein
MAASIQRYYVVELDLLPIVEVQIFNERDGAPFDFTGYVEPRFSMTLKGQTTTKVDKPAEIYNITQGILRYAWSDLDTDSSGLYDGRFHVKDASGKRISFPNGAAFEIHVLKAV